MASRTPQRLLALLRERGAMSRAELARLPLVGSNTEVVAGALGAQAGALGGVALVLRESERLMPITAR